MNIVLLEEIATQYLPDQIHCTNHNQKSSLPYFEKMIK